MRRNAAVHYDEQIVQGIVECKTGAQLTQFVNRSYVFVRELEVKDILQTRNANDAAVARKSVMSILPCRKSSQLTVALTPLNLQSRPSKRQSRYNGLWRRAGDAKNKHMRLPHSEQ